MNYKIGSKNAKKKNKYAVAVSHLVQIQAQTCLFAMWTRAKMQSTHCKCSLFLFECVQLHWHLRPCSVVSPLIQIHLCQLSSIYINFTIPFFTQQTQQTSIHSTAWTVRHIWFLKQTVSLTWLTAAIRQRCGMGDDGPGSLWCGTDSIGMIFLLPRHAHYC